VVYTKHIPDCIIVFTSMEQGLPSPHACTHTHTHTTPYTEYYIEKNNTQTRLKNVKRCRDGMPKSMQTR